MEKNYKQSYEAPTIEIHAVSQPLDVLLDFSGTATVDSPELEENWGDYGLTGPNHPRIVDGEK